MLLQRYDVARQLLTESGVLAQAHAATATMLGKLTRQPDLPAVTGDPRSAIFDLFATLLDPQRKSSVFWDADLEREFRNQVERFMPMMPRFPATARWYSDVLQSMISVEIEGDAGVWRVSARSEGQRQQFYLVLDRGVVKLIGATGALSGVGRYLLRGGDARADARARKLLDWIGADNDKPAQADMLAVKRLWGPAMPSSHDAINAGRLLRKKNRAHAVMYCRASSLWTHGQVIRSASSPPPVASSDQRAHRRYRGCPALAAHARATSPCADLTASAGSCRRCRQACTHSRWCYCPDKGQ
ncbi:MAG TPA: hypothetical protein VGD37_11370 [Kofleriaceae bacterium]